MDLEWMQRNDYRENRLEANRAWGVSQVTEHLQRPCTRKIVGVGREADRGWLEDPSRGFTSRNA